MSYSCPKRQNQQAPQGQNGNQKGTPQKPPRYGKVNHVSADTAQEALEVMLGTFSVNSISAIVLFDSCASQSFISQAFLRNHSLPLCTMKNPIIVNSPGGTILASYCCPSASISLREVDFSASLIVLRMAGIDVILGTDWMKEHRTVIHCQEKAVVLTTSKGDRVVSMW
jgi:hypothetical protein